MSVNVNDSKGLGEALKNDADEIVIEGDLKEKVVRIKAKGKVAWAVAIGAIGVAVASVIMAPTTGGTSGVAGLVTAPAAVSILGASTTTTAIGIAIAAGGVGALNSLRKYKIVKNEGNRLVLRK